MEFFESIVKAFGGGPPAAVIALLVGAVIALWKRGETAQRSELETAKQVFPVAKGASDAASTLAAALEKNTEVLRQMERQLALAEARANERERTQNGRS